MTSSSKDIHLERIIAGFLLGDSEQYQIIRRQIARLVDFWYSGRVAEREDLVAEIIKTLLENLRAGRFRGDTIRSFNSYVYGTTRFTVIRAAKRAKSGAESRDPDALDQFPLVNSADIHAEAAHRQLLEKIYAAIQPLCRELLELKFSLGWSDQEIADQRKMTKNAVSTAISRCIRRAQTLEFVKEILYQKPPYGHYEG